MWSRVENDVVITGVENVRCMLNTCKHPGSSFKGSKGWPVNLTFCNIGYITSSQKRLWASRMECMLEKSWADETCKTDIFK